MNLFAMKSSSPSILILGAGVRAGKLYQEFVEQKPHGSSAIIGFVPLEERDDAIPESLLLKCDETLAQLVGRSKAREIVIVKDYPEQSCSTQELLDCKIAGTRLSDLDGFLQRMRQADESRWDGFEALLVLFRRFDWR